MCRAMRARTRSSSSVRSSSRNMRAAFASLEAPPSAESDVGPVVDGVSGADDPGRAAG